MGTPLNPVRDVMRRTIQNLEFIERAKKTKANGPYEVTQLVNSFLGALAHPWERLKPALRKLPLEEAVKLGWPRVAREEAGDHEPESIGDLVGHMRHAFAHGHIRFNDDGRGNIESLSIQNIDPNTGVRKWGATIDVKDLRRLLTRFVAIAEDVNR